MGVREGLLALLDREPAHGYQLKTGFEAATGGVWSLNVGQVYATLDRLERDGLVVSDTGSGQKAYRITDAGADELGAWWDAVPGDNPPPRDELMVKVLLAVAHDRDRALDVITNQRNALDDAVATTAAFVVVGPAIDGTQRACRSARRPARRRCARGARRSRSPLARPLRGTTRRGAQGRGEVNPLLELRQVDKHYGTGAGTVHALRGVSLAIDAGELVAVRGPSGCGKSTLLHLAGGLDDPNSGHVFFDGRAVDAMNAVARAELRRRDIGYVFQRLNLVTSLTAVENVALPLELDGAGRRDARARALDALRSAGLTDELDRYPDDYSGGEQQRIAIARAIVGHHRLLLADEPTGSLDTTTGDAVIELLASLPAHHGTAVVLVTHEPRYAAWADRVVSLRDGQVTDVAVAPNFDAEPIPPFAGTAP